MVIDSTSKNRADCTAEFFRMLQNMIQMADLITSPPSVHWSPRGDGFIIQDTSKFYKHILPLFFPNINKQGSFTRKLNRNGMFKVLSGPEKGVWRHKDGKFFRGSHGGIGDVLTQTKTPSTSRKGPIEQGAFSGNSSEELFASRTSKSSDITCVSASPKIAEYVEPDEHVVDADLCDFFNDLENSITDDMLKMPNHNHLTLVRSGDKTVMTELSPDSSYEPSDIE